MGNKLYVGNLPYSVRDADLADAFAPFGTVTSAKVMMERDTGRSKGFGFVEMGTDAQAQAAIEVVVQQHLGQAGDELQRAGRVDHARLRAARTLDGVCRASVGAGAGPRGPAACPRCIRLD